MKEIKNLLCLLFFCVIVFAFLVVCIVISFLSLHQTQPTCSMRQAIHNKYADRGLSVVAFPCNQFGGQEPGSPEEIKAFALGQVQPEQCCTKVCC